MPERPRPAAPSQPAAPVMLPGGGLLLVDKPTGCTSHDVVGRLRHILRTRRIGHAGTLDPMATGLLVLAVDRSTKLLGHLALTDKTYLATIRLGQRTDTDDADGTVIDVAAASAISTVSEADIRIGIAALTGDLMQVPSSVSAIKVDGRRAYDRVRAGEDVELAARPVTVSRFITDGPPRRAQIDDGVMAIDVDVEVDCTTGTYIRSLARDLGAGLGIGGHLTRLRRTRVGPFDIADSVDVFGLGGAGTDRSTVTASFAQTIADAVIPAADAVRAAFPTRVINHDQAVHLRHGRLIEPAGMTGTAGAFDADGTLVALVAERDGMTRSVLGWQSAG